jgi:hypothetical protein
MGAQPAYLLNTVTIDAAGTGPVVLKAGSLITDASVQATIASAGGQLMPLPDNILSVASAVAQKLRSKGESEQAVTGVMLAAAVQSLKAAGGGFGNTANIAQNYWAIDPQNGSDSNTGADDAHPLQTWAGLQQRWGTPLPKFHQPGSGTVVTVRILSSQTSPNDPIIPDVFLDGDTSFQIIGPTTSALPSVHNGTFTGVTAVNETTGVLTTITDTALAGGFGPFVDFYIRDNVTGSIAIIVAASGAHSALVTQPFLYFDDLNVIPSVIPTPSSFTMGHSYDIVQQPQVNLLGIRATGCMQSNGAYVMLANLQITPSDALYPAGIGSTTSYESVGPVALVPAQCRFDGYVISGGRYGSVSGRPVQSFVNCDLPIGGQFTVSSLQGGRITDGVGLGIHLDQGCRLDAHVVVFGTPTIIGGAGAVFGNVGIFPSAGTPALKVERGATLEIRDLGNGGGSLWGIPAAGVPVIQVGSGSKVLYPTSAASAFPIGATLGFELGGRTDHGRGFDQAAGAYTAIHTETFANLDAATPGGFGGSCFDVDRDSAIVLYAD